MGLNASKVKGGNANKVEQPVMEAGTYPARLVQVIDFGLQPQRAFKGEAKPPAHEISTTYEFVDCFMVDEKGNDIEDKPRWVSETFPLRNIMADLATSTKRAKALDPENVHEGNWPALLGSPVNVTVVINESKGKVYTNIASTATMRAKDAQKCPELKNDTKFFDLSEPDLEVFNSLPEWIREKIKGNLNYAGSKLEALLGGEDNREAPKKEDKGEKPEQEKPARANAAPKAEEDEDEDAPW
jgi:hypothetical protein